VTDLLKKVLEVAERVLPDSDQNALAQTILEDIRSEMAWEDAFDDTYEQLRAMAERARADYRAGRTTPLDPEKL